MAGDIVRARLRKGKDDDIRQALQEQLRQGKDEADTIRDALRLYFRACDSGTLQQIRPTVPADKKPVLAKKEVARMESSATESGLDSLLDSF